MQEVKERPAFKVSGFLALFLLLVLAALTYLFASAGQIALAAVLGLIAFFMLSGFFVLLPNEAVVLTFFGKYVGSVHEDGFWWVNPFARRIRVSLRIENFNSDVLKVNDKHGNPIEIGAVVVWRVRDTAKAVFDVEDYRSFVQVQVETAIRALASRHPYDAEDPEISLRGNPEEIARELAWG